MNGAGWALGAGGWKREAAAVERLGCGLQQQDAGLWGLEAATGYETNALRFQLETSSLRLRRGGAAA